MLKMRAARYNTNFHSEVDGFTERVAREGSSDGYYNII